MNIVDVLKIKYPSANFMTDIIIYDDGNGILYIKTWNLIGQPLPTDEQISTWMSDPTVQAAYQAEQNNDLINSYTIQLQEYIDSVAQQKQYDNAISCISYANSTVQLWKDQAVAFIAWRDSVYNYVIAQEALMLSGSIAVPTFTQLQSELPVITWPTS